MEIFQKILIPMPHLSRSLDVIGTDVDPGA